MRKLLFVFLGIFCLLCKAVFAIVVFTDTFTVGADIDIASYPSGSPDYAYNQGTGLTVNAANDRVQASASGSDRVARIIDAAVPGTDQEIVLSFGGQTGSLVAIACVRVATDGTGNYYGVQAHVGDQFVRIYRFDDGSGTLIASAARSVSASGTLRLKATGTNPVALEAQVDATAVVTGSDSDTARKQTGVPGISIFDDVGNTVWIDNVSIDNLQSSTRRVAPIFFQ